MVPCGFCQALQVLVRGTPAGNGQGGEPSLARIAGNKSSGYPVVFSAFLCASSAPRQFAFVVIFEAELGAIRQSLNQH
jgi:hypothetical protein